MLLESKNIRVITQAQNIVLLQMSLISVDNFPSFMEFENFSQKSGWLKVNIKIIYAY